MQCLGFSVEINLLPITGIVGQWLQVLQWNSILWLTGIYAGTPVGLLAPCFASVQGWWLWCVVKWLSIHQEGFGSFDHAVVFAIEGLHVPSLRKAIESQDTLLPSLASIIKEGSYTYDCRRRVGSLLGLTFQWSFVVFWSILGFFFLFYPSLFSWSEQQPLETEGRLCSSHRWTLCASCKYAFCGTLLEAQFQVCLSCCDFHCTRTALLYSFPFFDELIPEGDIHHKVQSYFENHSLVRFFLSVTRVLLVWKQSLE